MKKIDYRNLSMAKDLYVLGYSVRSISKFLKIPYTTMYRLLEEKNKKRKGRKQTKSKK